MNQANPPSTYARPLPMESILRTFHTTQAGLTFHDDSAELIFAANDDTTRHRLVDRRRHLMTVPSQKLIGCECVGVGIPTLGKSVAFDGV